MEHIPGHYTYTPDKYKDDTGEYVVIQDQDAEDPRQDWEGQGIIITAINACRWTAPEPFGDTLPEELANLVWDETGDADDVVAVINALPGYKAHTETLHGYSQGDWQDILVIVDETVFQADVSSYVREYRQWLYGDVYTVIGPEGDALGGIYAESMEEAVKHYKESQGIS